MPLVPAKRIAEITGFSTRWVQKRARELGGTKWGGHWRFDEAIIRQRIKRETRPCRNTVEETSGGTSSSGSAAQYENRLDQLLGR